jgi:GTPase Era involved in 16S rRNA processing
MSRIPAITICILLTKIDTMLNREKLQKRIYQFESFFKSASYIIPVSSQKQIGNDKIMNVINDVISKHNNH